MQQPFWATPRFVFSAIFLYLAAHLAVRMAMGPGLSVDDSEQALFAQHYAWTYRYRAPPLFTWLLVTLDHVVPVGVLAIGLLRYAFLGLLTVSVYGVARRLIADPRLAALSVYGFAAIGTFAEASHRNLTHSTTLAAFLALAWYVFVRLAETPRLKWYLALGAVFGLGILAKWNFVILGVALPLACLLFRDARKLVLTWRILPAAAVAAAVVLPTVVATVAMGPPPGEGVSSVFRAAGGPGLSAIAKGTAALIETALIYALPLLVATLVLFAAPLWRGMRGTSAGTGSAPQAALGYRPDAAFLGATIAIGLALLWTIVLFLGATAFKIRYLYPALFILPVWLMMAVERGRPSDRAVSLFALLMAAMVVFVGGKRVAAVAGLTDCGLCTEYYPFPTLAADLARAGYRGGGTIVTGGDLGGNLRNQFPGARIIDSAYPWTHWPGPRGEGQCLLAWRTTSDSAGAPPAWQAAYFAQALHGSLDAPHSAGTASARYLPPAEGELRVAYWLYDQPNGACR